MLKLSDKLEFNQEQFIRDFESEETSKELSNELTQASALDIDATPTMFINGEKIVGVRPYYELKDKLIEHGAKLK